MCVQRITSFRLLQQIVVLFIQLHLPSNIESLHLTASYNESR